MYFINDQPNVTNKKIIFFANDIKVYSPVSRDEDIILLQEAINNTYNWTHSWLLKFNEKKCKVPHTRKNNKLFD